MLLQIPCIANNLSHSDSHMKVHGNLKVEKPVFDVVRRSVKEDIEDKDWCETMITRFSNLTRGSNCHCCLHRRGCIDTISLTPFTVANGIDRIPFSIVTWPQHESKAWPALESLSYGKFFTALK